MTKWNRISKISGVSSDQHGRPVKMTTYDYVRNNQTKKIVVVTHKKKQKY